MILEPKKTNIAYRCKECSSTVQGITGALSLTGDMYKLKCPCGHTELTLKSTEDEKIRVTVPCVFCGNNHTFLLSRTLLTGGTLFTYPCPYSGFDICFFGENDAVKKAIASSDKAVREALTEEQLQQLHEMEKNTEKTGDVMIRSNILFVLGDMMENKEIRCSCGTDGDYQITEESDSICIECRKCHKKRIYYCDESFQTRELMDASSVTLQ